MSLQHSSLALSMDKCNASHALTITQRDQNMKRREILITHICAFSALKEASLKYCTDHGLWSIDGYILKAECLHGFGHILVIEH